MEENESLIHHNEDVRVSAGAAGGCIPCQVCGASIDSSGKRAHRVLKCSACGEATPISSAPAGKRFVRCVCGCLLICRISGRRIACPRANCKRILTLQSRAVTYGTVLNSIDKSVCCMCGHCGGQFRVFGSGGSAACLHCGRVSSVGPHYARRHFTLWCCAAIVCIIGFVLLLALTWSRAVSGTGGLFVVYAGLLTVSIFLCIRAWFFAKMRISVVELRELPAA